MIEVIDKAPASIELQATSSQALPGWTITEAKGLRYVSHPAFGYTALQGDERKLNERILYALAGAVLQTPPRPAGPRAPELRDIARAIWSIRRDRDGYADLDLDEMQASHTVWKEAAAVMALINHSQRGAAA